VRFCGFVARIATGLGSPMTTRTVTLAAAALLGLVHGASAEEAGLTAAQEARVGELVRAYLLEHPEIINEALQALQERQAAEETARIAQALHEHRDELLADPMSPVGGNPDGDVTVVEFFDYNCPYCRAAGPVVTELLAADPDVRFVYKEFPTLAESSRFAARAALAARAQSPELYMAFHDALMASEGRLTEDDVVAIARGVGVDLDRMRAEMDSRAIDASLERNIELARSIGITGTPSFIIGDRMLVGLTPLEQMESAVADARSASASAAGPARGG
jgi:protein-disulfide isomerase